MQQPVKLLDQVREAVQLKRCPIARVPGCFPPLFSGGFSASAQPVAREHRGPATWPPTRRQVGSHPWPQSVEGTTRLSPVGP